MSRPATKATALWVIRRLQRAGHAALLAGGCVRDMLMGHRSSDYDVATSATPHQVKKLFGHVLLIGAKFGVAMVIHKGRKVEVTTFRTDLSYSDGRRPDGVRFTTPAEDASRRDFTINGMFYDPVDEEVIDYVGGRADLAAGLIRAIGSPDERLGEDYLRMLRAVRFAVRFDFRIDPTTAQAIRKHAAKITTISGERTYDELSKMLSIGSAAQALRRLDRLDLARAILPELLSGGLWPAAVRRVEAVARRRDLTLAFAALLCELPGSSISRIVRRWGGPNDLRDAVKWIAGHLGDWRTAADMPPCQFKRILAGPHYDRLRVLWGVEERRRTHGARHAARISGRARAIPPGQVAPPPLVTGDDLLGMGLSEGRRLGQCLRALYDAQLNGELRSRRAALEAAEKMVRRC